MQQLISFNVIILWLSALVFGLVIGSFLNVVAYRLPKMLQRQWREQCQDLLHGETFQDELPKRFNLALPRSHCPSCQQPIKAYHNIPIISYLLLKGRCAYCAAKISPRYPIIEASTALVTLIIVCYFAISWQTAAALVMSYSLLALTVIDIDHQLLPDNMTLPLLWLGLILSIFNLFTTPSDAIIGAVCAYVSLWLVAAVFSQLTGRQGMGHGDFKLFAVFGAWLGWQMLPFIILLAAMLGVVVGIVLILIRRLKRTQPIPFGPFLALAGWLALIWGQQFFTWYNTILMGNS